MDYTRIVLAQRPQGSPKPEDFRLETASLSEPGPGEIAVRSIWLSLDPYMRGRMDDVASYADPVQIGDTMEGEAVGEVIASNADGVAIGDIVSGRLGWATHGVLSAKAVRRIDPALAPISTALGVLGMPGITAWVGVNDILEAKEGETIVVSAATGAVGSLAGQLAKAKGLTVIGVAGGAEKCAFAVEELGFDACLDHRAAANAKELAIQLQAVAPNGVDCYFENVGAKTTEAVLRVINTHGRIAVCGMIAWYSGQGMDSAPKLPAAWRSILTKRLRVQGFIIFDHFHKFPQFGSEVAPMLADGRVKYRETVTDGLENAPAAFMGLLEGQNFGKQLVRVGADPA